MADRVFAIGDIHGCLTALRVLEEKLKFDRRDTVITLGDYVDRGPESCGVLNWLIDKQQTCNLVALRGNHEIMMEWARKDKSKLKGWLGAYVGGQETLDSYAPPGGKIAITDLPEAHWAFIADQTRSYHETDDFIFVHANVRSDVPMNKQRDEVLFWGGFGPQGLHISGKRIVCGHTEQVSGLPTQLMHGICIDTGAFQLNGWLTCLDVKTGDYYQANQRGELRSGKLEQFHLV